MLRFVEEIHFTRSFGNTPRIFRAICIAAQMLHLLTFPQFTITLSEFGHLLELAPNSDIYFLLNSEHIAQNIAETFATT